MDRKFLQLSDEKKLEVMEKVFDDYVRHTQDAVAKGKLIPSLRDQIAFYELLAEFASIVRKNLGKR